MTARIYAVQLEYVLCQINAYRSNLHFGRPFLWWLINSLHFGTLMPFWKAGVHYIIPAQAEIQCLFKLDTRLRGYDETAVS